jgi:DNA-directed RNA polymerase subunit beta'
MAHPTFGQLMLSRILPPDVYTLGQEIDKKTIHDILGQVADRYPERYKEISYKLLQFGRDAGVSKGGASFGIDDLATPKEAAKRRELLRQNLAQIYDRGGDDEKVVKLLQEFADTDVKDTAAEAELNKNPLVMQLKGAGRGSPASLARIIASDVIYNDSLDQPVPVPVLNSYSDGLTPGEQAASTFGARKGITTGKLSVADSGFLAKTLGAASHRLAVMGVGDEPDIEAMSWTKGLPVDTADKDNVGAALAIPVGPYKRNTILTPKILNHIQKLGHDEILVRSPLTTSEPSGGVYAYDVGIRENNRLPEVGSIPGLLASAAMSEPLTQSMLNAKHSGGSGKGRQGLSGFELLEKLVNPPKDFIEAAAVASKDGRISRIEKAPQGGHYIHIDNEKHYVLPNVNMKVKVGDDVEAGDLLSDGPINPRDVIKHKGLGEGSRLLTRQFTDEMRRAGAGVSRRNVEFIMRGMLDRVRMTDEWGNGVPGDLVPYSYVEANWTPREGHKMSSLSAARNKYLEMPLMHYTIGTRVTPSVINKLTKYGVKEIPVHDDPPPFDYEVVRAVDLMHSDPDWMTRNVGTSLDKGLLTSVHRAAVSDTNSSSFVPSRAKAVDFGISGNFTLPPVD